MRFFGFWSSFHLLLSAVEDRGYKEVMTKAESYLQHLFLAACVGDRCGPLYRTLFDNWYAYDKGGPFLSRSGGGTPYWFNKPNAAKHGKALTLMDFMSEDAALIVDALGSGGVLTVDHAIPVAVLRNMMLEGAPGWTDASDVERFLRRYYRVGVITAAEHDRLRFNGLNHGMPADWDGVDVFARYQKVGIVAGTAKNWGQP